MSTPRSTGRKLLLAAGAGLGLVVLLAVALLAVVNSGVATKRAVDLVLPSVSKALGREVTLKDARLKLFPNPRVTLAGLAVAGRAGEPALVEAEALDVEVGLWPLLTSLGKDVEVRSFTLVKPAINLVKAKDGTWNFEGLGARGEPGAPAPAPAPPPPAAPGGEPGAKVAVSLVKIDGASIRVVDRTQGKQDVGVALTQLDLEARGVGPGLPLEAKVAAALADPRQNLHMQLSVARLPAGVPQRPEDWPEVQGSLKLSALALERFHALLPGDVGAIVRGGTASIDAKLSTVERGYRVEGAGALADVRLRGQSSSGSFRALATWSPARPDAAKLDVTGLSLKGPGIDLGGSLSVETPPVRAWFVLTGPLLDLDAVMGVLPEGPAAAPAPAPAPAAAAAPAGELVPEATRRQLQAAAVRGTIAVEKLKGGRLEATDVKARATLTGGALVLDEMTAAVFGGRVSAAGTRVSLAEKVPVWKLDAKLSGIDLEQALAAFAPGKAALVGKLDGDLAIDGQGTDWDRMRDALTGLASLAVKDGALTTADLGDSVLGGVSKGLDALGRGGAARKVAGAAGGRTPVKNLAGNFTVKDGFLTAQQPFAFGSSAGDVSLGGRIGLDGRLGLEGKAVIPRKALAEVVSGISLPEKLEVPVGLGGTLSSPSVSVRAEQAAASLVKGQAKQAVEGAREKVEERGKKAVEGLLRRFGK